METEEDIESQRPLPDDYPAMMNTLASVRGCSEETFNEILKKFDLKNRNSRNKKKRKSIEGKADNEDDIVQNLNLRLFANVNVSDENKEAENAIEELQETKEVYRNEKNFSLMSAPELLASGGSQRLYFHQLVANDLLAPKKASDEKSSDAEVVRDVFAQLKVEKKPSFDVVTVGHRTLKKGQRGLLKLSKTLLLLWTGVGLVLWVVAYMILRLCYVI